MSVLNALKYVFVSDIISNPSIAFQLDLSFGLASKVGVRWRKLPRSKPVWLPVAKTKLFRIPKHPEVPKDEAEENERLQQEYRTKMASIAAFFKNEYEATAAQGKLTLELEKKDQREFEELLRLNDEENARVAKLREERYQVRLKRQEEELLQKQIEMEEWMKKKQEQIENLVRLEKERSKTYVTMEKLESAIEECIDNPVNYNFAVDLAGKIHWETFAHPHEKPFCESKEDSQELQKIN